jgi:PAS domain-containing protein
LKASEEKYRLIFDSAIEGIAVVLEGRTRFVNRRMLEMAGSIPTGPRRTKASALWTGFTPRTAKPYSITTSGA